MESRRFALWFVSVAYVFVVLWITIFSRIGRASRAILPLFWSYRDILSGDLDILEEDIKNVLLFVPFGWLLSMQTGWKRRYIVLMGLFFSLLIEGTQWLFKLGSTEVDDVINNTIGTGIGSLLVVRERKKFIIGILTIVILVSLSSILRMPRLRQMQIYAAMNDRDDGAKNLLVLDGNPGKTWNGDVYITYNNDGSITISGSSDVRSWKPIGKLTLEAGRYTFTGLSGTEPKTIAIELEYYNKEQKRFTRLAPDVGPVDEIEFTLNETTEIIAYVGVYPSTEGTYIARPAIYKEVY